MLDKKKKKIINMVIGFIGGIIFGAGFGYFIAFYLLDFSGTGIDNPFYYKLLLLPTGIIALWFAILIHEMGHVLAGISQRFEFKLISVGPVMFEKQLEKIVFKWNTNFNTFGGIALCLPQDQFNLNKRFAIFVLGGPLASMLWGIAAMLLLVNLRLDLSLLPNYLFDAFLMLNCVISLAIGIVTIIPMKSEGFTSDGGRLLNLLKGGPAAEIEATLLSYISRTSSGTRPSLLDPEPLKRAIELPVDSPFKPYFHSMLYSHYLDTKNLELAEFHLDEYLQGIDDIPKGYVAALYLEKAWFQARFHRNVSLAEELYKKETIGVMVPKALVFRAEAAIALAKGDMVLAKSKVDQALKELPKAIDKGGAIAETDWLREMMVLPNPIALS